MQPESEFWAYLQRLVDAHPLYFDRPKGSSHPRLPELIYPLDYGYLEGTTTADGSGIDCWLGGLPHRQVTAVVATVDLRKRDTELKILIGCSPADCQTILTFHSSGMQRATLFTNPYLTSSTPEPK